MINNGGYNIPTEGTHNIATKGSTIRSLSSMEKSSNIANAFGPGIDGNADFSKANDGNQNVKIVQITPDGEAVETWILVNPIIKSVDFGGLSYDSDEAVEYKLNIEYDYAKYE